MSAASHPQGPFCISNKCFCLDVWHVKSCVSSVVPARVSFVHYKMHCYACGYESTMLPVSCPQGLFVLHQTVNLLVMLDQCWAIFSGSPPDGKQGGLDAPSRLQSRFFVDFVTNVGVIFGCTFSGSRLTFWVTFLTFLSDTVLGLLFGNMSLPMGFESGDLQGCSMCLKHWS